MKQSEGPIVFELWDPSGRRIALYGDISKLPAAFQQNPSSNFREAGFRNVYRANVLGSVRLVVDQNDPQFQGTKGVTRSCAVYLSLIPKFKQIENSYRQHFHSIIKRFAHNLIKFQTRFKGNFSRLISDSARGRPFNELQDEVKRRIEANTDVAAQDVSQMSHRATDLDAQIETLRVISGYSDSAPENKIKVNLQKTIFRLANPFIEEFKSRGVEIKFNIPQVVIGDDKVLLAPGLFNAAFWQLLDNASKYALDNAQVEITAHLSGDPQILEIVMTSVCIDEDEVDTIFLEGQKGRHAGKKAENGIGLFIVRKALSLMDAQILVRNEGFVCDDSGYKYCKHRFIISFSR